MDPQRDSNDVGGSGAQTAAATCESYEQARKAVDRLSAKACAVERVSIVARDLGFVEQVTARPLQRERRQAR